MSCKTFLAVGIVGLGLALSSSAHAITVNPATGVSYNFVWNSKIGGNSDIDGVCEGALMCDPNVGSSVKSWSINVEKRSVLERFEVEDGYKPGDEFGLTVNGQSVSWSGIEYFDKTKVLTNKKTDYFRGYLTGFILSAGVNVFSLTITKSPASCTLPGQVLTPCTIGRAFAKFGALSELPPDAPPPDEEVTAVPVPAALPLLATGLGILGFGAWRRRR